MWGHDCLTGSRQCIITAALNMKFGFGVAIKLTSLFEFEFFLQEELVRVACLAVLNVQLISAKGSAAEAG
jgi:hypothetical protein